MRTLPTWSAGRSGRRPRPRLTWAQDMWRLVTSGSGPAGRRRDGAMAPPSRERLGLSDLTRVPALLSSLTWRVDYRVLGLERLRGIQPPVVLASNETGPLDWRVLRAVLPAGFRTTVRRPSRALSRGRSVVVFTGDPIARGGVGEFSTVAAELANQHNVPIVPVGILGTLGLTEALKLSLRLRPRVTVRFGAPVYVRGRTLADATAEIQSAVGHLAGSHQPTWWESLRTGDDPAPVERQPRWRRQWEQTAPAQRPRGPRIWT